MHGHSLTVVIPSRNRPELLERALASLRDQTAPPDEVIVVDNVSDLPIDAAALSQAFGLRVRVLRNDTPALLPVNRNRGWQAASGDVVCFLDDDDWYLPQKCADLRAAFDADPGLDFAYGRTDHLDGARQVVVSAFGAPDLTGYLLYRYIHCNALAVRRDLGLAFRADMDTFEDVDFIGRLLRDCRGLAIDAPHAVWLRDNRPDQITQRNLPRAYRNTLKLYQEFAPVIDADPALARYYHRRLCLLGIYTRHPLRGGASALRWAAALLRRA